MKKRIIFLIMIFLAIWACESPSDPGIEEIITPEPEANIVLDGALNGGYMGYDMWGFNGYVKNIGDGTGYNCQVSIQCFSDSSKTTIIDTAFGFPADLGNIDPGQRAYFEAIAFEAESMGDITYTKVEITWLNR